MLPAPSPPPPLEIELPWILAHTPWRKKLSLQPAFFISTPSREPWSYILWRKVDLGFFIKRYSEKVAGDMIFFKCLQYKIDK